jgi:hypothetical protein
VAQFLLTELIGPYCVVDYELANRLDIGLLGPAGQATQLHVLDEALA